MPKFAAENWCFLTGMVSSLESQIIRNDNMQRMSGLEDINDVFLAVSDTSYKDLFPIIEKLYEADSIISEEHVRRLKEIARFSPTPEVAGIFLMQYDVQNFKAYLKNKLADMNIELTEWGTVPVDQWEAVSEGQQAGLPEFWARAARIINAEAEDADSARSIQVIDLVLDSEHLNQQIQTARAVGYPLIIAWAERLKIAKATEVIWRSKKDGYSEEDIDRLFLREKLRDPKLLSLLRSSVDDWPELLGATVLHPIIEEVFALPAGQRLTEFSRRAEDFMLDAVREGKHRAFGPERVFGYLCGLRNEIFNLRLVLSGKVNKISTALLQARVRRQYV